MSQFPKYYSTHLAVGNATTSAEVVTFGFNAHVLRLENLEAVDMYVNLQGNLASTVDMLLKASGGKFELSGLPPIAGIGIFTTSTTAGAKLARVVALG